MKVSCNWVKSKPPPVPSIILLKPTITAHPKKVSINHEPLLFFTRIREIKAVRAMMNNNTPSKGIVLGTKSVESIIETINPYKYFL